MYFKKQQQTACTFIIYHNIPIRCKTISTCQSFQLLLVQDCTTHRKDTDEISICHRHILPCMALWHAQIEKWPSKKRSSLRQHYRRNFTLDSARLMPFQLEHFKTHKFYSNFAEILYETVQLSHISENIITFEALTKKVKVFLPPHPHTHTVAMSHFPVATTTTSHLAILLLLLFLFSSTLVFLYKSIRLLLHPPPSSILSGSEVIGFSFRRQSLFQLVNGGDRLVPLRVK